jgi:hypothetical protein
MSFKELSDWRRFERIEPLPDRLADIHNAMLCSIVVNLVRSSDAAPVGVPEFFVLREPSKPEDDGPTEAERMSVALRGGS